MSKLSRAQERETEEFLKKDDVEVYVYAVESLKVNTGVTIIVGTEKGLTDEERNAVMAAAEELDKKLNCD